MPLADPAPDLPRAAPVAVCVVDAGVALAWAGGARAVATSEPTSVVHALAAHDPRWVWWSARECAALVGDAVRPRTCWDLAAVAGLASGLRRTDAGAVWAAAHDLDLPVAPGAALDLFDLEGEGGGPVRDDGQLSREWLHSVWRADLETATRWAELALEVHDAQERTIAEIPDPRAAPGPTPLAMLVARSESAAALLCAELEHDGLPFDRDVAAALLTPAIGPPPRDPDEEVAERARRDDEVLRHFPGGAAYDLRNPAQVRELLQRIGIDVPDTRSGRLTPYAASSPGVAALLQWRKAERLATTYGWRWMDECVGADGRLRGAWGSYDGGAGRMTASSGLHNLPAELRPAVRAEPGYVLVRADLGQIEPRVLAAVSGDEALAHAAQSTDLYAPVAAQLGCERATAKVAVLSAMYGGTAGSAAAALRDMDRAYPRAMAFLREAEDAGRRGVPIRTWGGRLLRLDHGADISGYDDVEPDALRRAAGYGRFARNAVIQGAAAELFKAWAATVRDALANDARIVLCLHDELVLHVPAAAVDATRDLLVSALAATARWWCAGSAVQLIAEVTHGESWADAHG
ncbi:MAG TPA: DNA polymerase [Mycobacteriales bacterium]|nr:DNA polymerase [Mycobacteriales bacterium]